MPHQVRELHAGHLKRAVADNRHTRAIGPGDVDAERRRHGEAHRRVVGRADELGLAAGGELGRAEQRVADVGDHDRAIVELLVEPVDQPRDGDAVVRPQRERLLPEFGRRGRRRVLGPRAPGGERPHEIGQLHVVVVVVAARGSSSLVT